MIGTLVHSATSNNMKLVHWPLMGGPYIWYGEEGTKRGPSMPRPVLDVPNVTAHPSTASVPITVLLYNGPLLCGFKVPIKGLSQLRRHHIGLSTSAGWMAPFLSRVSILTRDIDIASLSVRLSVYPSVTFRYCMKTA